MANFIDDLGEMLQTGFRSNGFSGSLGSPNGTVAAYYDYTDEDGGNKIDGDNVCNISYVGQRRLRDHGASAQTEFTYLARFKFNDVAGAGKKVAKAGQSMDNVFAERGRTLLTTHLTDNGSNWLGKSGQALHTWEPVPQDQLADKDFPAANSTITITLDHNVPLA